MLGDMAWLNANRAKLYGSGIAIALVVIFSRWMLFIYSHGGYDVNGDLIGADFSSFWAASREIFTGRPADVYVPSLHKLAEATVLKKGYEAFFYPPTYLILCLPLALAPYFVSYVVFLLATAALYVSVIWNILRSPWALVAVLSYAAVYLEIIAGQNGFLTAAIMGAGLSMMDRRPALAGAILGLMAIKPHLALGVPVALIVTGRWRTFAWAGVTSAGLVALSYLLFGPQAWLSFFDISRSAREMMENGEIRFGQLQSVFVTARILGASVRTAYILHGLVALGAVAALIWALTRPLSAAAERSTIVLACVLITPFSLFYDMLVLTLPLAWMAREWEGVGYPTWSKPVLCVVYLAPMTFLLPMIYNLPAVGPLPFGLPAALVFGGLLLRETAKARSTAGSAHAPRRLGRAEEVSAR